MRLRILTTILLLFAVCFFAFAQNIKTQSTIKIGPADSKEMIINKAAHVVPTPNQYEALKNEFIAFIHFGPNTFTRKEWGNGKEDPAIFKLENLDTDQWCEAMKAAGMKMVILTAKHHDGFCLWQTRYTKHGIMSSPFKGGKGDVMKDVSESCQKYGLKLGVYLSPADLYQIENKDGLYGNLSKYTKRVIPRAVDGRPFENKTTFTFEVDDYNEYMLNQLFELLTEYGPIDEVWFDGAHPKRKGGQTYNYAAWKKLIQTLAPKAVIFGRQDLRWCGNESGGTRDSEWNIIPYQDDPNAMNRFADITGDPIAQREQLYGAKYLHYQPAETNTSIREGWFYRDDHDQRVRNADDVFDIYERSVGGNSIFLLNIPPNREGKFSDEDVAVLHETGKRINKTYGKNLFANASGVNEVLDNNAATFTLIESKGEALEIETPKPVTINRFVVQEAITSHGERIEKFAVDAWLKGQWQEITESTNVGYKRILRFPQITSSKFRIRVLDYRKTPAISNVSAHFYKSRPPQLAIQRNLDGKVSIEAQKHTFRWKPHGENSAENLDSESVIRYTSDGSEPNSDSKEYTNPFMFASGEIKAKAFNKSGEGSVAQAEFGIIKKDWTVKGSSDGNKNKVKNAIDANTETYWNSGKGKPELIVDMQQMEVIGGFIYTPPLSFKKGLIEKGTFSVSKDGKNWKEVATFDFGNLINDPTPRVYRLNKTITTRHIRIKLINGAGGSKSASIAEIDILQGE